MEYYHNGISQIINLLDNRRSQLSKLRTKNWIEVNGDARRT